MAATILEIQEQIKKMVAVANNPKTNENTRKALLQAIGKAEKQVADMKKSSSTPAKKQAVKAHAPSVLAQAKAKLAAARNQVVNHPVNTLAKNMPKSVKRAHKLARKYRIKQKGVPKDMYSIKRDAGRPAKPGGKRITDGKHFPYIKGHVYYEGRENRKDRRQPPVKYPKLERGGPVATAENIAKVKELEGKKILVHYVGVPNPDVLTIKSIRVSPEKYDYRDVFITSSNGGESKFSLSKLDQFLDGQEIVITGGKEPYAIALMKSSYKSGGRIAYEVDYSEAREGGRDNETKSFDDLAAANAFAKEHYGNVQFIHYDDKGEQVARGWVANDGKLMQGMDRHYKYEEGGPVAPGGNKSEWMGGTGKAVVDFSCSGKAGLKNIVEYSKKYPKNTYLVTDDNYSRIGQFWLRNGKFANVETWGNPDYDLSMHKTTMKAKDDVIYKFRRVNTHDFYEAGGPVIPVVEADPRFDIYSDFFMEKGGLVEGDKVKIKLPTAVKAFTDTVVKDLGDSIQTLTGIFSKSNIIGVKNIQPNKKLRFEDGGDTDTAVETGLHFAVTYKSDNPEYQTQNGFGANPPDIYEGEDVFEVMTYLKENMPDDVELVSLEAMEDMQAADEFADGGYVAVSEKDGVWVVITKPTTREKAQEMLDMSGAVLAGEQGKVVTVEDARAHSKLIGGEYLKSGGHLADTGKNAGYPQPGREGMFQGGECVVTAHKDNRVYYYYLNAHGDKTGKELSANTKNFRDSFAPFERMEGDKKYAKGGGIPNNYEGKTPAQVWAAWDEKQRYHFLHDHVVKKINLVHDAELYKKAESQSAVVARKKWSDIPMWVQLEVKDHMEDGQYAEGGTLSEKADYVSNRDISDLTLTLNGHLKKIKGSDVIDGVHVKKGVVGKSATAAAKKLLSGKVSAPVAGKKPVAQAVYDAVITKAKTYKGVEDKDTKNIKIDDIQELLDAGYNETDIIMIYLGYAADNTITSDTEFGSGYYPEGIMSYSEDAIPKQITQLVKVGKSHSFSMGLKYPDFSWEKVIEKYGISKTPKYINSKREWSKDEHQITEYEIYVGKEAVIGHSVMRHRYIKGKLKDSDNYGAEKLGDLKTASQYQKDRNTKIGFNSGYWGIVSSSKEVILDIAKMLFSQKNGYAKDVSIFTNTLGGVDYTELDENRVKYAEGGELKSLLKEYDDNTATNNHSENVVLLAKHFGTEEDVEKAKAIVKKHEAAGHMSPELMAERDELSHKLYPKLVAVRKHMKTEETDSPDDFEIDGKKIKACAWPYNPAIKLPCWTFTHNGYKIYIHPAYKMVDDEANDGNGSCEASDKGWGFTVKGQFSGYVPKEKAATIQEAVKVVMTKKFEKGGVTVSKRKWLKDADIKLGNKYRLPNGEIIEVIRLFTENFHEPWVEFNRDGKKNEASVNGLKNFLNNWKAEVFEKGGATFNGKATAIAKKLVGKKVPAKYQKENGKRYSKSEAIAAAKRITGKMVSGERKKK